MSELAIKLLKYYREELFFTDKYHKLYYKIKSY